MAMQIGNGNNRGRRYRPLAEINVTPMVDVMLVLLVIFMITAPLMTSSVNVDLPKASASPITPDKDPITVSVASDSKVYLGNDGMDLTDLVARLQGAIAGGRGRDRPRPPHLRARRQDRAVRAHDRGDGHHQAGRLQQGGVAG